MATRAFRFTFWSHLLWFFKGRLGLVDFGVPTINLGFKGLVVLGSIEYGALYFWFRTLSSGIAKFADQVGAELQDQVEAGAICSVAAEFNSES
ncbi:hypothetical protein VNO78_14998 [Psophocarpus tetragonolobus]|uniref:Uncharacterized protein n=1 Tax=Psophocarpus tetragonolobus TaxID=3891 RepID=A0AAN9XJ82_PSOTE